MKQKLMIMAGAFLSISCGLCAQNLWKWESDPNNYCTQLQYLPVPDAVQGLMINSSNQDYIYGPSTDDDTFWSRADERGTNSVTPDKTRFVRYQFEPGKRGVPRLPKGRYFAEVRTKYAWRTPLNLTVTINGKVLAGPASNEVAPLVTSVFDYQGGPFDIQVSARQAPNTMPNKADRLRLQSITIKPVPKTVPLTKQLCLENDSMKLGFARNGVLLTIFNKVTGTSYTNAAYGHEVPFRIKYLIQQSYAYKDMRKVQFLKHEAGKNFLKFHYQVGPGLIKVTTTATLTDNQEVRWDIDVQNRSTQSILGVNYPILNNLSMGNTPADDVLYWPYASCQRRVGQGGKNMRACYEELAYPGTAGLPLIMLEDPMSNSLFYLMERNTDKRTTLLRYEPSSATSIGLAMEKLIHVPNGTDYHSSSIFMGVCQGDWHDGADRYRTWAQVNMPKIIKTPDWMRRADGMSQSYMNFKEVLPREKHTEKYAVNLNYTFEKTFRDIPALLDKTMRDFQIGDLWAAYQMVTGFNCYRYYYPDPNLGTPQEFARSNEIVAKRGGHAIYYTNGMNWDRFFPASLELYHKGDISKIDAYHVPGVTDYSKFTEEGRMFGIDGKFYQQYAGPGRHNFTIMDANSKSWRDYIVYWTADKYAGEYKASGMQIDQIGLVYWGENYRAGFGLYGRYGTGLATMIRDVIQRGRAFYPDYGIFIEGAGDVFGQYVSVEGLHIATPYYFPELYRYTMPGNVMMLNNDGEWRDRRYEGINERMFLASIRDSHGKPEPFRTLSHRTCDFLYYGDYRHTRGLGALPAQVKATVFEMPETVGFAVPIVDSRSLKERVPSWGGGASFMRFVLDPAREKAKRGYNLSLDLKCYPKLADVTAVYYYAGDRPEKREELGFFRRNGKLNVQIPGGRGGYAGVLILSGEPMPALDIEMPKEVKLGETATIRIVDERKQSVKHAIVHVGDRKFETDASGKVRFTLDEVSGYYAVRAEKQGSFSTRGFLNVVR